ncbi:MAG: CHAT domain-containing protein [Anaerolineae bacterium]|nr:CHAT domain-containing protein [Anaerolineae bacterium]
MTERRDPIDINLLNLEGAALAAHAEGRYDDAILLHARAIARASSLQRPRLTAALFSRLGLALDAQGAIQRAVQAFETGLEALSEARDIDLEQELASLGLVGKTYGWPDLLEMPDLFYPATPDDLPAAEDDPLLAVKLLINIGNAYLRQPQEGPALNAYERALAREESAADPALRAHVLTHVGIIRRRRDQMAEAEAALTEALALLEAHSPSPAARRVWAALAGLYAERGEPVRARAAYERALALYEQSDDPVGLGRALAGLGRLQLSLGELQPARAAFERALDLLPSTATETLWYVLWGLGCSQAEAGELEAASRSLGRSLELIKRQGGQLRTDEGRVTFLDSVQTVYERLLAVQVDLATDDGGRGAWRDALQTAEEARGQAFEGLLASRRAGHARAHRAAGLRESRLRPFAERLAMDEAMTERSGPDAAPWVQRAPSVQLPDSPIAQRAPSIGLDVPADLLAWLEARVAGPTQADGEQVTREPGTESAPDVTSEGALSALDDAFERVVPPMTRLVYHTLPDRTAIFVVDPQGAVTGHICPLGRETWAERVARLRAALDVDQRGRGLRLVRDATVEPLAEGPPGPPPDPAPLLRELYAQLVAPLVHALPPAGVPVVIEPHGPLWLLPYAALLGPDGVWFGESWPLLYAPSGRILEAIRAEHDYGAPAELSALIVGNPDLPSTLPWGDAQLVFRPLPGAELEAEAIAALFPGERRVLLMGPEASRERVQALMPNHGIVHLASHGLADAEDPNGSFVILGGGAQDSLLTARHVLDLSLPADLVALSACQTGLGRVSGDGIIGLSRAFLAAGARAVLVSLWSVSDAATAALMTAFYQHYLALDDKAIALQRAMRVVRALPEYAHPRFWAPFVVIGVEA